MYFVTISLSQRTNEMGVVLLLELTLRIKSFSVYLILSHGKIVIMMMKDLIQITVFFFLLFGMLPLMGD